MKKQNLLDLSYFLVAIFSGGVLATLLFYLIMNLIF